MKNSNGLYFIIGALVIVIAIGGYYFYQQQHKTGIDIKVGGTGISVETK